jgi:hypothetical protein
MGGVRVLLKARWDRRAARQQGAPGIAPDARPKSGQRQVVAKPETCGDDNVPRCTYNAQAAGELGHEIWDGWRGFATRASLI